MGRRNCLSLAITLGLALGCGATALAREAPEIQQAISAKQKESQTLLEEVNRVKNKLSAAQGAVQITEVTVRERQVKHDEALANLKRVEELARDRPDVDIRAERALYAKTKEALEEAVQVLGERREIEAASRSSMSVAQSRLDGIRRELRALEKELSQARFEQLRRELERTQVVEVRGEAACGMQPMQDCQRMALAEARRMAVERGSALLVDSITEVENYQITKDRIRAGAKGIIVSEQVLRQGPMGNTGYFFQIRAMVKGQVPEGFRPLEPPPAPHSIGATPEGSYGNRRVEISWLPVPGAEGYHLYWSDKPGVTPQSGTRVVVKEPAYSHQSGENGKTYYYVVVAVNASGESEISEEVSAKVQEDPQITAIRNAQRYSSRIRGRIFGITVWTLAFVAEIMAVTENDSAARDAESARISNDSAGWQNALDKRERAEQDQNIAIALALWGTYLFFDWSGSSSSAAVGVGHPELVFHARPGAVSAGVQLRW